MKADLRGSSELDVVFAGPSRPSDRASIRRTNLGLVLRMLRDGGPRSRSRIADDTGLPKPTVTKLVADLAELGLVRDGEQERDGSLGRPSQAVELHGSGIAGVGVEISVDYVCLIALSLRGDVIVDRRVAVDVASAGAEATLDLVAEQIRTATRELAARGVRVIGVTLAVPGVVDVTDGRVDFAANIGWRDVPVLTGLRRRLRRAAPPLRLENDAKLGATAEYLALRDADIHDLLYITCETGVGAGIICDGRLLRGARGFAGEIGHMPLDPAGHPCPCGRTGCWETMVGLNALLTRAADPGDRLHDRSLDLPDRLADLRRRVESGDDRAARALADVADALGLGIGLLVDVLNPRAVILGGYLTHIGDLMLDPIRAAVRERVMLPDSGGCEILPSALGFTAPARGGAHVALDAVYQDPGSFGGGGTAAA